MLKEDVREFVDSLLSSKKDTWLILSALMTETLSRNETIVSADTYLYRLFTNYKLLGDSEWLESKFSSNKNFVEKNE
jgi:hypothetical protein